MSQTTDSDSTDSDDGVRFKTANIRKKEENYDLSKLNKPESASPERCMVGPVLPPNLLKHDKIIETKTCIGPQLPPHLQQKVQEDSDLIQEDLSIQGPQLPPHLRLKMDDNYFAGPALPPNLSSQSKDEDNETKKEVNIGPFIPLHLREKLSERQDSDEDEDIYGPVPVTQQKQSKTQIALEERALQLKLDQLAPQTQKLPSREEWMLELPAVKAGNFGLGPRQFRAKPQPDLSDRSSWTDTPDSKGKEEKKVDLKKEVELKEMRRKDDEQEKMARKHKKKTDSLLEMHQSKIKKQKKDEKSTERRPFSREIDLQVNKFDETQKKAVLKKAQLLDDRFSSGQSKFL